MVDFDVVFLQVEGVGVVVGDQVEVVVDFVVVYYLCYVQVYVQYLQYVCGVQWVLGVEYVVVVEVGVDFGIEQFFDLGDVVVFWVVVEVILQVDVYQWVGDEVDF